MRKKTSIFNGNMKINGKGVGIGKNGNGRSHIQLRDLVKTYSNAAGDFEVLKSIDVDIHEGEFVAVIGKSGSGKSTLINMITGIDRPTSGEVFVGDVGVHELSENQMAAWRGRNIGIVFQFFQLLPTLSLVENIMLPMDFCNMYTPRERKKRAMELLEMVEMTEHAKKLPSAISGGQQQRVAIARALANDPPIVIADEPTGNLDSKTAEAVFRLFEIQIERGKTILMVTHDASLARRVSRTMLLADGEIVNEWVAKALPTLSHQQMLEATRNLERMTFAPGQALIQENEVIDQFFILTKGFVEVALKRPDGNDVIVNRIGPGQYVGEIELLREDNAIATVRAAETGVEAVSIDRDTFVNLLSESEDTRMAVENTAEERADENSNARESEV
jgi:putative ABC transport system ATP-binding protein